MNGIGPILTSLSSLLVAIGTLVVLLKTGGLVGSLAAWLGPTPVDADQPGAEPEN